MVQFVYKQANKNHNDADLSNSVHVRPQKLLLETQLQYAVAVPVVPYFEPTFRSRKKENKQNNCPGYAQPSVLGLKVNINHVATD